MSNTGARPDQIEKAAEAEWRARGGVALKRWDELCDEGKQGCYQEMREHASYLCPVGSAIIDAEDVAAIRRIVEAVATSQRVLEMTERHGQSPMRAISEMIALEAVTPDDLDRLRRIGGEDAGERGGA